MILFSTLDYLVRFIVLTVVLDVVDPSTLTDTVLMTARRHQSSSARSVLRHVARMKLKQEQKRIRIGHGKWLRNTQHKRQSKRLATLGTWNTRQLGATTGYIDQDLKLEALMDLWDVRQWEMVALTDTKLGPSTTLATHTKTRPPWTVISRGRVALALNERWTQAWQHSKSPIHTDGKGQQCRMMLVQIPCFQRLGLAILTTYAPNVPPEEHETYLQNLETLLSKVKHRYTLILAGDFNAEVGTRSPDTGSALGPHGPPHRNTRGLSLCQFCNEHGLAVANTWTAQRNKTTWWHPRFGTAHLIDYFLITQAHIGNVHRVLTLHPEVAWTAQIDDWTSYTDHNPVEMTVKLAPPKGLHQPRNLPARPATYKGRGTNPQAMALRSQYHHAINQKIQDNAPHQTWDEIATLLTQTAEATFGTTQQQSGKPWFVGRQAEIRILNNQVSTAKQHFTDCTHAARSQPNNVAIHNQLQQAKRQLHTIKRMKRRQLTQWERQYWHTVGQQAEAAEARGDTYVLYSLMSKLKVRKANNTKSSLKRITCNPFAEAESWKEHFSNIQNGAIPVADRVWNSVPQNPTTTWLNETPTIPELTRALAKMKIGKAPGDDGVTVEMLKWAPQTILDNLFPLHKLFGTPPAMPPQTLLLLIGLNPGFRPRLYHFGNRNIHEATKVTGEESPSFQSGENSSPASLPVECNSSRNPSWTRNSKDSAVTEGWTMCSRLAAELPKKSVVHGDRKLLNLLCTILKKRTPVSTVKPYGHSLNAGGHPPNLFKSVKHYTTTPNFMLN